MYSYLKSKRTRLSLFVFFLMFVSPVLRAQPSTNINDYVLFAYEELHFKGRNGGDPNNGVIEGGNVGVNSCNIPNTKNLTFGGPKKNRLMVCASTSIYSVYLNDTGAQVP